MSRYLAVLAGLHGLCGVAFAAIGAHAPAGPVVTTGATMQLIHAAAALGANRHGSVNFGYQEPRKARAPI